MRGSYIIPTVWHDLADKARDAVVEDDPSGLAAADARRLRASGCLGPDDEPGELWEALVAFGRAVRKMGELKLKVYGWQGHRHECPPARNGNQQTREVVAAKSKAAVARAAGVNRPSQLFNLGKTGAVHDIVAAMSAPGRVFWCPIDDRDGKYKKAKKEEAQP